MNRKFYLRGGVEVDPITHTLNIVGQYQKKYDDLRIYIGTDSQNKLKSTHYVGVIAYRFPGDRGAHFIYCSEHVKKIRDINEKLRGEVDLSMEIATALYEHGVKIHCIDFDFNSNDLRKSHAVVNYAKSWALGMGFDCTVKPDSQIASRAADNIVRSGDKKTRNRKLKKKRMAS